MRLARGYWALALLTIVGFGCGGEIEDEGLYADAFLQALPQSSDLQVALPGAWFDLLTATLIKAPDLGAPAEFYGDSRAEARSLNAWAWLVPHMAGAITRLPPRELTAERAFWGPLYDPTGPGMFYLTVNKVHQPPAPLHYNWLIQAGLQSGIAIIYRIAAGSWQPAAAPDSGEGWLLINLDDLAGLDPAVSGNGLLYYHYARSAGTVSTRVYWMGRDSLGSPFNAGYAYDHVSYLSGSLTFASQKDLDFGAGLGLAEDLLTRTRWAGMGAGRSDLIAQNGDLEASRGAISQCWNDFFNSTYELFVLAGATVRESGDPAACALATPDLPVPSDLPGSTAEVANPYGREWVY